MMGLLVIDVQEGIDESAHWGGARCNPEAEGNIKLLLSSFRAVGLPIIIVQHSSETIESPFHQSRPGHKLKQIARPLIYDILVEKRKTNAFIGTALEVELKNKGVNHVVITGFVTNNSVESTARMSAEIGFRTTVISDATAAFNLEGLDGSVYPAELVQQMSLSNLKREFANILSTRELLSILPNEAPNKSI